MRLPDFEAWAIFAAVARLGSFTAAAKELSLSKATISKAVTRLETDLGSALFHRTSRRISLSGAGKSLLPHAIRIVAEGTAAVEAAKDEAASLSGIVRVAAPLSFGLRNLGPILAGFMGSYPDIEIDLHLSDARVDLIDQGFDLALRIAALPDSSLRVIRLREVRRYMVAAPSYLEKHGVPAHPSALSQHRCFIYANLSNPENMQFTGRKGEAISVRLKSVFQANNSDVMIPALIAGHGIAQLPDFMCDDALAAGELQIILPDWQMEQLALNIVMPPSLFRPARVEAFINYLKTAVGT